MGVVEVTISGLQVPAEWESFKERNAEFLKIYPRLDAFLGKILARSVQTGSKSDQFLLWFCQIWLQNFFAILVLCSNGFGGDALKLLRSMFELGVTTSHLAEHPDQLDSFLDYHWIRIHKQLRATQEDLGPEAVPAEWAEEIERNFASVKSQYEVEVCSKCGSTRINHSWTRLDLVSMARGIERLRSLIAPAYYIPLNHVHAGMAMLAGRVSETQTGLLELHRKGERQDADLALKAAHHLALESARLLAEQHFESMADMKELELCNADFVETWPAPNEDVPPETKG